MKNVILIGTHLEGAKLTNAYLEGANLFRAYLEEAEFTLANMQRAYLNESYLGGAKLAGAHLEGANLRSAHLEGISMPPTNLRKAFFDSATELDGVILGNAEHGFVKLADVSWGGVNLSVVKWSEVKMLGDEFEARQTTSEGKKKDRNVRLGEYERAVRANRQLAIVLRNQGLNEKADHFAYRAQLLQRKVLWRQHESGRWLFSMLLALLSGYGYRIWRILVAYLLTVSLFALAYFVLGMHFSPHLHLDQAYLESITAFHGRVFLEQFSTNTPQIWLTALEAIAGLVIEGVFIAMLIQRFFGK